MHVGGGGGVRGGLMFITAGVVEENTSWQLRAPVGGGS